MDEPLAALDEARKEEILPYIERLRDEMGVPIVYVSHSIPEVTRLATTLVLLEGGRVAAAGPTESVMARTDLFPGSERSEAGALLATRLAGRDLRFGLTILRSAAGELRVPDLALPIGTALRVRIRARDVMIALRPPEGLSALNVLPVVVADIGPPEGSSVDLRLDCGGETLVARLTLRSVEAIAACAGPARVRGDQEHRLRSPGLCRNNPSLARRRRRDAVGRGSFNRRRSCSKVAGRARQHRRATCP
jgi:molybdate transport system ATP-binding protein